MAQALPNLPRTTESPLLRLPQELLIRVASYLTTPELGHLRRVCKDVESRLFESFAYEFFHKRQFMVEEPSLQALIEISKHPTLSKRLTEVILSTNQYGEAENLQSMTAQRLYLGGYTNSHILISCGQARDMLVEAFNNLPNLRKVGLRDYDANGRFRDGENAKWRSFKHSVMEGETARSCSPDQAWFLLLQAVALSNATIPSIEVFLRHQWRLSDGSFDVLSTRMARTIAPVLAQLGTLMLTLGSDRTYYLGATSPPPRDVRLKKFLHHTPALERLRLNFDEGTSSLLDWLAQIPTASPAPNDFTAPLALPHLTTLDLGMVKVDAATLLSVLTRFELKTFNLWRVTLAVDDRSKIKTDADGEPSAATKFLDKLAASPATRIVERAMLGILRINGKSDSRQRAYDVDFPPIGTAPAKKPAGGSSLKLKHQTMHFNLGGSAPNFGVWAREMAKRAVVFRQYKGFAVSDTPSDLDEDDSVLDDSVLDDSEVNDSEEEDLEGLEEIDEDDDE